MTPLTKQYYKLSEVADMLCLPSSTIKYWTMTFDELDPPTTKGGHRRYRPEDIDIIRQIKVMMHDKVMSIEGARKQLQNSRAPWRGFKCNSAEEAVALLRKISDTMQDNPKSVAMLDAVARWIEVCDAAKLCDSLVTQAKTS